MITFAQAQRIAATILTEAPSRTTSPLTIAVLDAGGHLVLLNRQDDSGLLRPEIAMGKAWGALGLGFSSRQIANAAQRLPEFFSALNVASGGRMIPAAGGVLIRENGRNLGAVGVSGSESWIDEELAIIAVAGAGLESDPAEPLRPARA